MWQSFYEQFITFRGYEKVLLGLRYTIIIAVFGLILGFLLGSLIAIIKTIPSKNNFVVKVFQRIGDFYVMIFRGTPMVVQLLIIHYVLFPLLGINIDDIIIGKYVISGAVIETTIAFALNSAAYISEIMRGGINSVDKGQLEAGRALGLSYPKTMVSIVVPQAFKNILPTLGNEFITLIKETSVANFIGVTDLYTAFQRFGDATYEFIVPYLMLALCYLILVLLISALIHLMEKKLKKA